MLTAIMLALLQILLWHCSCKHVRPFASKPPLLLSARQQHKLCALPTRDIGCKLAARLKMTMAFRQSSLLAACRCGRQWRPSQLRTSMQ